MTDYDSMNVSDLLGEYAKWANKVIGVHWSGKVMVPDEDLRVVYGRLDLKELHENK